MKMEVNTMPNNAEVIKELSAKLELYRLFALSKGLSSDEDVLREVTALLQRDLDDNSQPA